MTVNHATAPQGELSLLQGWPDIELDGACEITGGEPLFWVGDTPVAARATHGKGSVMAVGFGSLWNDGNMGEHWMLEPDPETALRFDVLFSVVRALLADQPVTPPPPEESALQGATDEPAEAD